MLQTLYNTFKNKLNNSMSPDNVLPNKKKVFIAIILRRRINHKKKQVKIHETSNVRNANMYNWLSSSFVLFGYGSIRFIEVSCVSPRQFKLKKTVILSYVCVSLFYLWIWNILLDSRTFLISSHFRSYCNKPRMYLYFSRSFIYKHFLYFVPWYLKFYIQFLYNIAF